MTHFLAIEDAVHPFKTTFTPYPEANARLGDLFFFDDGIGFVPYHQFHLAGVIEQGLATLLGGLGGAMMTSPGEAIREVAKAAKSPRERQWGIPIRERLTRSADSVYIPRAEIAKIEIGKGVIGVSLSSGTTHTFLSRHLKQLGDDLGRIASGENVHRADLYEQCGLNLGYKAPALVVEALISDTFDAAAAEDGLSLAATNAKYMTTFRSCFSVLKRDEKARAAASIARFPKRFKESFVTDLRRERQRKSFGCLFLSVLCGLPFVIGILGAALGDHNYRAAGIIAVILIAYVFVCRWGHKRSLAVSGHDLPLLDEL